MKAVKKAYIKPVLKWVQVPLYDPIRVYGLSAEDVQKQLNKIVQTGLTNERFCAKIQMKEVERTSDDGKELR